jgi:hypothetical protein
MKPLILILLAAVVAQAQTIADAARRERARQAQVHTTKIFTTEDVKNKDSRVMAEARPVENPTPVATPAAAPTPIPAAVTAPAIDPVQQWTEETGKLRTRVRELIDQETAALLEINTASGQINAPITSQSAKDQAQRTLEASQQKLVLIRAELTRTRSELQEMDLMGPPARRP